MFTQTRFQKLWLLLLIGSLALVMVACGAAEEPAGGQPTTPEATAETGVAEPTVAPTAESGGATTHKVATFIFTQELDTLNPLYTQMWFSAITQQIWNTAAWDFDDQNNAHAVLVKEIPSVDNGGVSADGRTITLVLRDDIEWSDGTPITSADFRFTYDMSIDPANVVASTYPYDLIASLDTPDEHTVVVTFNEPFAPWLARLFTYLLPKHVLEPVYQASGSLQEAPWNLAPTVSAGPYVFAEWETGSFLRFERNTNYFGAPPIIDEIFIQFVPDDASQVAALQTGQGDLGTFIAYSDVPTLKEAGVNILSVPSGYNEGWFFYLGDDRNSPVKDVAVRQAVALGLDRAKLSSDLLLGLTTPAVTFWDDSPYAAPELQPWPYDPERAKTLLDQAGWVDSNGDGVRDKDGVELILTHGTTNREIRQDTQAVAQQQLAEIGIKLELQSYPADTYFASYSEGGPCATGQLDICESSNNPAFPDPDTSIFTCREIATDENPSGVNDQHLCDPALDALFAQQATQVDFAARQATFHEISSIVYEQVYWLGIWRDPDIWALSSRVSGAKISGATPFWNIGEWDLTP